MKFHQFRLHVLASILCIFGLGFQLVGCGGKKAHHALNKGSKNHSNVPDTFSGILSQVNEEYNKNDGTRSLILKFNMKCDAQQRPHAILHLNLSSFPEPIKLEMAPSPDGQLLETYYSKGTRKWLIGAVALNSTSWKYRALNIADRFLNLSKNNYHFNVQVNGPTFSLEAYYFDQQNVKHGGNVDSGRGDSIVSNLLIFGKNLTAQVPAKSVLQQTLKTTLSYYVGDLWFGRPISSLISGFVVDALEYYGVIKS